MDTFSQGTNKVRCDRSSRKERGGQPSWTLDFVLHVPPQPTCTVPASQPLLDRDRGNFFFLSFFRSSSHSSFSSFPLILLSLPPTLILTPSPSSSLPLFVPSSLRQTTTAPASNQQQPASLKLTLVHNVRNSLDCPL